MSYLLDPFRTAYTGAAEFKYLHAKFISSVFDKGANLGKVGERV
jgi:hypothetical protein